MLTDREVSGGAYPETTRQFQADQPFLKERSRQAAISNSDSETLSGFGDVSLLMRQFYQSPARSAG